MNHTQAIWMAVMGPLLKMEGWDRPDPDQAVLHADGKAVTLAVHPDGRMAITFPDPWKSTPGNATVELPPGTTFGVVSYVAEQLRLLTRVVTIRPDGIVLTREQLESWAGRELGVDELDRLGDALPQATLPDVVGTIVGSWEAQG